MTRWLLLLFLASSAGCVQLVALDQPIIGQPDVVEEAPPPRAQLCDAEIAMGESSFCNESCRIDGAHSQTTCGQRVRLEGARASLDMSGLREVELTFNACARAAQPLRIVGPNGASVAVRGRALEVRAAEAAHAHPYREGEFLPASQCEDRSLLFQTGRMELAESGRRLCSAHLVPVEGAWTVELGGRDVELCFREARQRSANAAVD